MLISKIFRIAAGPAFLGIAIASQGAAGSTGTNRPGERDVRIPASVTAEHEELHKELAKVIRSGGRTAEAAKEVDALLQPHFVKEEQFALPPLAALADLAADRSPPNVGDIIKMSERLKTELPAMLAEHGAIVKALDHLQAVARNEHKPEGAHFAEQLKAHAKQEEEILYPAAILVGDYLRQKQR